MVFHTYIITENTFNLYFFEPFELITSTSVHKIKENAEIVPENTNNTTFLVFSATILN